MTNLWHLLSNWDPTWTALNNFSVSTSWRNLIFDSAWRWCCDIKWVSHVCLALRIRHISLKVIYICFLEFWSLSLSKVKAFELRLGWWIIHIFLKRKIWIILLVSWYSRWWIISRNLLLRRKISCKATALRIGFILRLEESSCVFQSIKVRVVILINFPFLAIEIWYTFIISLILSTLGSFLKGSLKF